MKGESLSAMVATLGPMFPMFRPVSLLLGLLQLFLLSLGFPAKISLLALVAGEMAQWVKSLYYTCR